VPLVPEKSSQEIPRPALLPRSAQTKGSNFLATNLGDSNPTQIIPLDAMGAVGPAQILVVSNVLIKALDKSTGSVVSAASLNTTIDNFFTSVRQSGTGTTDVRARFDPLSQRFFVTALDGDIQPTKANPNGFSPGNHLMLAVSNQATLDGTTTWSFYNFVAGINGDQADSDTIGIDANALYIGVALFGNPAFDGCAGFVVPKDAAVKGNPIVVTTFSGLCDKNGVGTYIPQGVDNDDPAPAFGYMVGPDVSSIFNSGVLSTSLKVIRFANTGTTPVLNATFTVSVPAFGNALGGDRVLLLNLSPSISFPIGVPVKGCNTAPSPASQAVPGDPPAGVVVGLDDLDQRLTIAQIQGGNLWTVHNIDVDASGNAVPLNGGVPTSSAGRDGARWYAIDVSSLKLSQSGTLFDPTANASSYFVPTLAVSGQGHMAIAATRGGPNEFAEIATAGHLSTDPPGSLQSPIPLQGSTSSYNVDDPDPAQRWGDYSVTCVDPSDQMTLWTFQEYCDATDSVAVQVISLKAPLPAVPLTSNPVWVSAGVASAGPVTITGDPTGGAGYYPGTAAPNILAATVSPGVVTSSVTFVDPTHFTMMLDTTGATAGLATVHVTNPDGQVASGPALVIITPGAPAGVTDVTSSVPNGTYQTGQAIPVEVVFSDVVTVTGTPTLALNTGALVSYTSGSGTPVLTFNYLISSKDTATPKLDVAGAGALVLPMGATITSSAGPATVTVPAAATPHSLSGNKALAINPVAIAASSSGGGSHSSGCGLSGAEILLPLAAWARRRRSARR
jgi:hypothetical protein